MGTLHILMVSDRDADFPFLHFAAYLVNPSNDRPTLRVPWLPLRIIPAPSPPEIGCGSGAATREIARRIGAGHVLAIDRSAKAIALARVASRAEVEAGRLSLRQVAAEDFTLQPGDPEAGRRARRRIAAALIPNGRLFIDGGDPLREIFLDD